jgi:hypothetical protein
MISALFCANIENSYASYWGKGGIYRLFVAFRMQNSKPQRGSRELFRC